MKKGFFMRPSEVEEIKKHLTTFGCTECCNHIKILRWVPNVWYVNCPDCEIIYKFDFDNLKAERAEVSWDHLLRIAAD